MVNIAIVLCVSRHQTPVERSFHFNSVGIIIFSSPLRPSLKTFSSFQVNNLLFRDTLLVQPLYFVQVNQCKQSGPGSQPNNRQISILFSKNCKTVNKYVIPTYCLTYYLIQSCLIRAVGKKIGHRKLW